MSLIESPIDLKIDLKHPDLELELSEKPSQVKFSRAYCRAVGRYVPSEWAPFWNPRPMLYPLANKEVQTVTRPKIELFQRPRFWCNGWVKPLVISHMLCCMLVTWTDTGHQSTSWALNEWKEKKKIKATYCFERSETSHSKTSIRFFWKIWAHIPTKCSF